MAVVITIPGVILGIFCTLIIEVALLIGYALKKGKDK